MRRVISEVPFAKDAGSVTRLLQKLRERGRAQGHAFAFLDRVSDAVAKFMPSTQQRRPRGRARRAHVELRESGRDLIKPIEIRRLEQRITEARKISHALIVRHEEDDVGPRTFQILGNSSGNENEQDKGEQKLHGSDTRLLRENVTS